MSRSSCREDIKQQEREQRSQRGALADVPRALPALPRAQKLQKRAARVGFDWSSAHPVFDKLREECLELEEAVDSDIAAHITEEIGDLLFTCVNLSRHLGVDAEEALRGATRKFESRFANMEATASAEGQTLQTLDVDALGALWERAKRIG